MLPTTFSIQDAKCEECGHQHAGPEVGGICIGCPCVATPGVEWPRPETTASIAAWQRETFGDGALTQAGLYRSWDRVEEAMNAVLLHVEWGPNGSSPRYTASSTPRPRLSRALRALEEAAELVRLLAADDGDPKACEEVADIAIVLSAIPGSHGREMQDDVNAKMAVNRARKWAVYGDGNGQHVKEEP